MQIASIIRAIALATTSRDISNSDPSDSSTGCQGANGTATAQCQRLYGGKTFRDIPECTPKDELGLASCISSVGADALHIPACNTSMFEGEFPEKYLECIGKNSGISYMVECNTCRCMCNGLSECTKKGCVAIPPA